MRGVCTSSIAVLQNVDVNVFHPIIDLDPLLILVPVVLQMRTDRKKKRKFFHPLFNVLAYYLLTFSRLRPNALNLSPSKGLPHLISIIISSPFLFPQHVFLMFIIIFSLFLFPQHVLLITTAN